jgi:hypothetical protein
MRQIAPALYINPISNSIHVIFPEILANTVIKMKATLWKMLGIAAVINFSTAWGTLGLLVYLFLRMQLEWWPPKATATTVCINISFRVSNISSIAIVTGFNRFKHNKSVSIISPSNRVAQLYPQAPGSLFVTSYDSQGYDGGTRTRLYTR